MFVPLGGTITVLLMLYVSLVPAITVVSLLFLVQISDVAENSNLSHLVGKPTMWIPNRSDTNRPAQAQKRARSLKIRF